MDGAVLAHNWLMNSGLANARIRVRVENSRPSHLSAGFANDTLEGEKGLIMSAPSPAMVMVHMSCSSSKMEIPLQCLCPELPTGKKQPVVVVEGVHAGCVFLTKDKDQNGKFPLVTRGYSRGKAPPPLTLSATSLARCNPLRVYMSSQIA
jgi:hypothetical protein